MTDDFFNNPKCQSCIEFDLLNEIENISHVGHWDWDIENGTIHWSDEIFRIFDEEPDSFEPNYDKFLSYIPAEDLQEVIDAVSNAIEGNSPYDVVHRIQCPSRVKTVHERGRVFYDDNERPIRMIGTVQDITEVKLYEDKLQTLVFQDQLVNCYNRRYFTEQLQIQLALLKRDATPFVLLLFDLDDFSEINNKFGHVAGDYVLQRFTERLNSFFKRETDFVARLGGDEFGVVMHVIDESSIDELCKACRPILLEELRRPYIYEGKKINMTASGGILKCLPGKMTCYKNLLAKVDEAMYTAKKSGKNNIYYLDVK